MNEVERIAIALQENEALRNLIEVVQSFPKDQQPMAIETAVKFLNERKSARA